MKLRNKADAPVDEADVAVSDEQLSDVPTVDDADGVDTTFPVVGRKKIHKKVMRGIEEHKRDRESVRFVVHEPGAASAIVVLDDRILIVKGGWMAGSMGGARVTSLDFSQISAVQVNTGMINATIEVQSPAFGATKAGDFWSTGKDNPHHAPNVIASSKSALKECRGYLRELDELVAVAHQSSTSPVAPESSVDALSKLAELHAAGVLSDAEFEDKKAELLARI